MEGQTMIRIPAEVVEHYSLSERTFDGMTEAPETAALGRRAVFTTYEGERRVGIVEAATRWSSGYPIIRFANGTWGRADDVLELIA